MSYIRPRIRVAATKKTKTSSSDVQIAAEKIMSRFNKNVSVSKPPTYKPIENFEFYAKTCLVVAKNRYEEAKHEYKMSVDYLLMCRTQNLNIFYAVKELQEAMLKMKKLEVKKEEERIEKMRELEKIHYLEKEVVVVEESSPLPLLPIVDINHVCVNLKVQKKSKNVKVKLTTPLLDLHEKYYKNLIRPPIVEKILTYSKIGYPEWYLEKMLVSHGKQLQRKPEMKKFIETVFAKYDAKKPSKTKPKTLIQIFSKK
jgi:hypothetical protein